MVATHDRPNAGGEQCAYCGEPAGDGDWADRQWGLVEEPGPGGLPTVRHVHATCYLHRHTPQPCSTHPRTRR